MDPKINEYALILHQSSYGLELLFSKLSFKNTTREWGVLNELLSIVLEIRF